MEARVDESQKLADSLLAQHYEEWVPHWVADGYERVRSSNLCVRYCICCCGSAGMNEPLQRRYEGEDVPQGQRL